MRILAKFLVVLIGTTAGCILVGIGLVWLFGTDKSRTVDWEAALRVLVMLSGLIGLVVACMDAYDDLVVPATSTHKEPATSAPDEDA